MLLFLATHFFTCYHAQVETPAWKFLWNGPQVLTSLVKISEFDDVKAQHDDGGHCKGILWQPVHDGSTVRTWDLLVLIPNVIFLIILVRTIDKSFKSTVGIRIQDMSIFFNVGPLKESIFLTIFYGLYFSHQYTNITNYISSWYRPSVGSFSCTASTPICLDFYGVCVYLRSIRMTLLSTHQLKTHRGLV